MLSLAAILIIGLIQATALDYFEILGLKPDLLLIYALFSLFYFPRNLAIFSCLACGLIKDAFSLTAFGANTLFLCIWAIVILRLSKKIYQDNPAFTLLALLVVALMNSVMFYLLNLSINQFQPAMGFFSFFFRISVFESFYCGLAALLSFKAFQECASKYFISSPA